MGLWNTSTTILILWMMSLTHEAQSLRLINMSAPIVADIRGEIDLDCRFDMGGETLYAVKWYKNEHEFFRYMPSKVMNTISYPVAGIHVIQKATDCSLDHCRLRLSGLTRDHSDGSYKCEISSDAPTFRSASEAHNVTIAALPQEALRVEGLTSSYSEGDLITANCISDLADPAPILSWYINNLMAHSKYVGDMTSSKTDAAGLVATSLTLRFPVDRKHAQANSIELRCVATQPGIPQPPQSTTKLVGTRRSPPQVINNQELKGPKSSSQTHFITKSLIFIAILFYCNSP